MIDIIRATRGKRIPISRRLDRAGIILCCLMVFGCASSPPMPPASSGGSSRTSLTGELLGIEVQAVRVSANGHLLDFRYRVKDPEKARPLLEPGVKPYLIDQKSGRMLTVPEPPNVGSLRQKTRQPEAGRVYFIIFGNPGKLVRAGEKVTVVIGNVRLEGLVVE